MGNLARLAFSIGVAALSVGCGGSQPPIAAPGVVPQSRAITTPLDRGGSWMLPAAKSGDLLYISDVYGVHIFSYPKGLHVGDIYGIASPAGLCSNKAGDVFVTDTAAYHVYEYPHGSTKPIKTLYDNYVDFNPIDCSVDPTTGNLAVSSADSGFVVVFPKAQQSPQVYYENMKHVIMYRCAYDDKGDLFVDQVYSHNHRRQYIGDLANGTTQFKNYLLDQRISRPGGIQFDGRHVAVEDLSSHIVYRLRFSGSQAVTVGTTPLNGTPWVDQYWIQGRTLIGPDENNTAYFWRYPEGHYPVTYIQGFTIDIGATVSINP